MKNQLNKAHALYKKRYALLKKRVAFPTNTLIGGIPATNLSRKGAKITLYGESGSWDIFSTIAGYRCVCLTSGLVRSPLLFSVSFPDVCVLLCLCAAETNPDTRTVSTLHVGFFFW